MKKNYENLPYEFLLLINDKPIVGRNFSIRGFNSDSLRSLELKEVIDDAVNIIKRQFKSKTSDYLFKYYNPYFAYSDVVVDTELHKVDIYANEDIFTLQIKVKGNARVLEDQQVRSVSLTFYSDFMGKELTDELSFETSASCGSKTPTTTSSRASLLAGLACRKHVDRVDCRLRSPSQPTCTKWYLQN